MNLSNPDLRRRYAVVLGKISFSASIGLPIPPDRAAEYADELEAIRVAAGCEPLKLYHKAETA